MLGTGMPQQHMGGMPPGMGMHGMPGMGMGTGQGGMPPGSGAGFPPDLLAALQGQPAIVFSLCVQPKRKYSLITTLMDTLTLVCL